MTPESKKHIRRLDLIRGTLVLTLILYIVVALVMNSSYLTLDRLLRLRVDIGAALSNDGSPTTPLESNDTREIVLFQDGFAVLSRNGLSIRSDDGVEYSSHVLQYKEPCIEAVGKYLLCFDRGGTEWCVFDSFRRLCSGTEEGDIINGSVSDDGYVAIASEREVAKGCVTVYNTEGLALARWNSQHYLLDSFFFSKSRLTVVSLASAREKTDTVFTVFDFKSGEVIRSVSAPDTFPLAMEPKKDGTLELLTATGALSFDGNVATLIYSYPEPSPGVYRQRKDYTMISYHTLSGAVLVQAMGSNGTLLFSAEYPSVLSLDCSGDRFFVLTDTELVVLNSSGEELLRRPAEALEILASPEITLLRSLTSAETLDLSVIP